MPCESPSDTVHRCDLQVDLQVPQSAVKTVNGFSICAERYTLNNISFSRTEFHIIHLKISVNVYVKVDRSFEVRTWSNSAELNAM